ncbi:MAG: GNAT family N-acetyltransferase [Prevotella sp.]|nr:GNAT family N-acetyltransferase [Prevotella sp.]
MFDIRRYREADKAAWDAFVAQSKNGTFLFCRDYMDYHADRFSDHSLMFFQKGRLYALLPANEAPDGVLWTHQGLSYGGLITDTRATAVAIQALFCQLGDYLRSLGMARVVYKAVPWIYHSLPSEEDLFALVNTCRATIADRSLASVLMPHDRLRFTESRRSGLRKAVRAGLRVHESPDVMDFWPLLEANLHSKFNARPVHTAQEMSLLKSRFPEQIRIYVVSTPAGVVMGGTVLYLSRQVVRTQYISASPEGKACGAIDLLFDELLNRIYPDGRYIDFGTSMLRDGTINQPLLFQKEGFGGRAVCYDIYEWDV